MRDFASRDPSAIRSHIGSRLRERRVFLDLSQRALAAMVGITHQQVRKYEAGIDGMSADRLYAAAGALNVPVAFFFEGLPPTAATPAPSPNGAIDGSLTERESVDMVRAYRALPGVVRKNLHQLMSAMVRSEETEMAGYRIYFLNAGREIRAVHWFEAEDDDTAAWIAERLYTACSDACVCYELWQGARMLAADTKLMPATTAQAVVARRQEMLVQHEQALRDSAFAIARSRRLLEGLKHLVDDIDRAKQGDGPRG